MANPWFRMYSEFATDPKVQMLSEVNQRRLTMLFCFRCNELVTLQDTEISFMLRISYDEWMVTKSIFIDRGFIDENNQILNWDKRQFSSDTSKNRVAAYRERKKQQCNVTETLLKRNSNAIDTEQIQNRTDTEHKNHNAKKQDFFADLNPTIVNDYLQVRKAKRAPKVSQTVYDGLLRESGLAGISLEQALTVCIERNWVGFKAEWYSSPSNKQSGNVFQMKQDQLQEFNRNNNIKLKMRLFGSEEKEVNDAT